MADIPPEFTPDTNAAISLMITGLGTLTQAVEGIASAVPAAALTIHGIRRAQQNFQQALAVMTPPDADPVSPEDTAPPVEPDPVDPVVAGDSPPPEPPVEPVPEPVDPAPVVDETPPADPPPSPDPQPEDNDG